MLQERRQYITWSFNGAEISELLGSYTFGKLSSLIGRENRGLAAINSSTGPVLNKMRKNIIPLIKD